MGWKVPYYEKDKNYKDNVLFFVDNAIKDDIDYLFVINGDISFEDRLRKSKNMIMIKRLNKGFDFGGYSLAIQLLQHKNYDYYFFTNSSTIGPIIPVYVDKSFDEIFEFFIKVHYKAIDERVIQFDDNIVRNGCYVKEFEQMEEMGGGSYGSV